MMNGDAELPMVVLTAAKSLGYSTLKPEQHEAVVKFASGRDVFVSLPTGHGKSLCYILLPPVFDSLRGVEAKSVVLVVSPLVGLMRDQVTSINKLGMSAMCLHDCNPAEEEKIKQDLVQVLLQSVCMTQPCGENQAEPVFRYSLQVLRIFSSRWSGEPCCLQPRTKLI